MQYRYLGRTRIRVSEVSFGAHVDEVNVKDEKRRAEQIMVAVESGINLFDIYDHSGYRQWEPMSKLLHPIRDKVIISLCTVWDSGKVLDEVNYALKVFKTDYIDLYRFVLGQNMEENERRLYALLKAKEEGKVRAVGAAVHVPSETLIALGKHPEELDFVMVAVAYCFRRAILGERPIGREIRRHSIGVIAMKPLCGHEEPGGSHLFRLSPPAPQVAAFRAKGLSLAGLAIRALLESDLISTVMPTMNSVEEVLENITASGAGALTEDEKTILNLYCRELEKKGKDFLKAQHWLWNWR